MRMVIGGMAVWFTMIACATAPAPAEAQSMACAPMTENMALEGRASPYDSTLITVDGQTAKICYGRPSARGRTMIGGEAVPFGQLWRTGANEPTTLHLPFAATIAGMDLDPGSYSLYTMPGLEQWVVIVNRSTSQWGHESRYTADVRAQEVGRGMVPATGIDEHVETFTIRSEPADAGASLILEWENTRVAIPVSAR
ncbi:MAG TPA: DUF2911 domain-containing protein [Longimicrobiales bacterium]|nr:DUF2911 domain-containing protein [Longimicrobiales bacterium]